MKVGVVGLGKLGLPVALAIEEAGHDVAGWDPAGINDQGEPGVRERLETSHLELMDVGKLVAWADIIFVAIQTPHDERFEGDKPLEAAPVDFDYSYLLAGIREVAAAAFVQLKHIELVVISTCLPGTYRDRIAPAIFELGASELVHYTYNPFFIAMGTVIHDFTHPEFVLVGTETGDTDMVRLLYATIHDAEVFMTDIITAEGIKVLYNTFVTTKTVLGNLWGEMAHKLGMNADHIVGALSLATDRLISPAYLSPGVGDGGGCHPRDNIALSWLARRYDISFNFFDALMEAREKHMGFIADLVEEQMHLDLPVVILGRSFKPQTTIETGSASKLLSHILEERGVGHQHVEDIVPSFAAVYVIGTKHLRYRDYRWAKDSVVIDPFRYIPWSMGVRIVPVGGR